jgi:hypothetical protein
MVNIMTSVNQLPNTNPSETRWNWLYYIGSIAALIVFVVFLIGIIGILTRGSQLAVINGWFTPLQNNWLVVLFKLNAGFSEIKHDSLNVLNLLDVVIMLLMGMMFLALYVALRRANHLWSLLAASLPFLGIVIFLITHTAGRSGLPVGGLIISAIILRSKIFGKANAYLGIIASALLFFAGDLGTTIFTSSMIIAILIGLGYVMWMIWFALTGCSLFQLRHSKPDGPTTQ